MLSTLTGATGYGDLLVAIPVGVAIVLVTQGPWITALLFGRLRFASAITEAIVVHEKLVAAADARTLAAEEREEMWRQAWLTERTRGDEAVARFGEAGEVGKTATHLLASLLGEGKTTPEEVTS